MQALVVVDAQNEFSPAGQRAVPNHAEALEAIERWTAHARANRWPIAWVRHHNRPHESPAFVPGSWGAELSPGLGPKGEDERLFEKDVFGAFTTTGLDAWLRERGVRAVTIVGFFAHMCVSTSAREALVRDYEVSLDPAATGAHDLEDPALGRLAAADVVRTAMLQLVDMGAAMVSTPAPAGASTTATAAA